MLKSKQDVSELLAECGEILEAIDNSYRAALTDEDIVKVARPKIKSCLEHLRSALEYIAMDLSNHTNSPKTKEKVYFPYGKDKRNFRKYLCKVLPDLEKKYVELIESIQPFSCGSNWLIKLCSQNNISKHIELQKHTRINSEKSFTKIGSSVSFGEIKNVKIGKITEHGKLLNPKPITLDSSKSILDTRKDFFGDVDIAREYESVKFVFQDTSIDIKELLVESYNEIRRFSEKIYTI